ncbi:hypothetical protein Tco_0066440 [Tanacetum coccineum]
MSRGENTVLHDNPILILQYFPHVFENHGKAHAPPSRRVTTFYLEYARNGIEFLFTFYLLISFSDRIRVVVSDARTSSLC